MRLKTLSFIWTLKTAKGLWRKIGFGSGRKRYSNNSRSKTHAKPTRQRQLFLFVCVLACGTISKQNQSKASKKTKTNHLEVVKQANEEGGGSTMYGNHLETKQKRDVVCVHARVVFACVKTYAIKKQTKQTNNNLSQFIWTHVVSCSSACMCIGSLLFSVKICDMLFFRKWFSFCVTQKWYSVLVPCLLSYKVVWL